MNSALPFKGKIICLALISYFTGVDLNLIQVSVVLGISAFYHDAAACLLRNGKVLAAAQEERFSRIKHDSSFPSKAIAFCLSSNELSIEDVDLVVFYEKPFLKFDRIIDTYAHKSPYGFWSFRKALKSWISEKLWIPNTIRQTLNYKGALIFSEHHEAHAASAFFSSPYQEAAILTMDGVGEKCTTAISIGKNNEVKLLQEQHFPHSLGLFYSAFTYYCGFKVNSGEYKLMGLAPYGEPHYKDLIYEHFIAVNEEGVITLNTRYFDFEVGLRMTNKKFDRVFGQPRRTPEGKMTQFYKDVARSAQEVLEEVVLLLARTVKKKTKANNLCLAGGVALNCKANQRILEAGIFDSVWVQPAAGDSGGALGAAYVGTYHYLGKVRVLYEDSLLNHIYLGKAFADNEIVSVLNKFQVKFSRMEDGQLLDFTAQRLNEKAIVGWFQGRMEYGPRALGSRSILASPKFPDMQRHLNLKIKKREGFRPFAPMVLSEKAAEWFQIEDNSKYMLFTFNSHQKTAIPSCIHVDNTARVQTVAIDENEQIHGLLKAFETYSGIPVLINTSFNVRGEPIVCTVEDALRCFFATDMDYVILGNYVVSKDKNKKHHSSLTNEQTYVLD